MFDGIDPLTCTAGELLAWVSDHEPGPMAMSLLLCLDRTALSAEDAITFVTIHERISAWWASVQLHAVVAAASPEPWVDEYTLLVPGSDEERTIRVQDAIREEFAAAVRLSPATAQRVIDEARLLTGSLSETGEALCMGEVSQGHVRVIVEAAGRLPGRFGCTPDEREAFTTACRELQRRVLPTARRGTPSMTRTAAARAVLSIDAEGERRRREAARCTRDVWVTDQTDGISLLMARMATEQAHAVMSQLDAHAHDRVDGLVAAESDSDAAPGTTIGEHRVEALAALILGGGSADRVQGGVPAAGIRAHLDIVVDLPTVLGILGLSGADAGTGQAEIRGSGPVSADVVRDLLADPEVALTMRRLVADPLSGHLLDHGRRTYEVPQALREHVIARDGTCRFPGCRRRAGRCQIDHAEAWDDGGKTDVGNLGALCVRHHQLKTHGGWEISDSERDGSCTWTSPQGRRYQTSPPALGPPPF